MASRNEHRSQHTPEHEQQLEFLLHATDLLAQTLDYRETLRNVCSAAVGNVADIALVYLGEPGATELVAAVHLDPALTREVQGVGVHLESAPGRPKHPVCLVLKNGETFYAPRIDAQWIDDNASNEAHAQYLRRMHYTSMIVVPLRSRVSGLTGALTLATVDGHHAPFSPDDVRFAEALGRLFAAAIGKARLYDVAHATADSFQRAALPSVLPQRDAVEFYARYEPASETLSIGGDWYDAFPLPDGRIGICLGDAAGSGLSAAVLMASMRMALRGALAMEPYIIRALDVADHLMRSESTVGFCTALLAVLDLDGMTLRVGNAGHPGPKIWDPVAKAVVDPFTERDLPLGLRDLTPVRTKPKTIRVEKESFVTFYTDGLVEWNKDLASGERALESALRQRSVREARDPALAVRAAVIGTGKAHDDTAILVLRFK